MHTYEHNHAHIQTYTYTRHTAAQAKTHTDSHCMHRHTRRHADRLTQTQTHTHTHSAEGTQDTPDGTDSQSPLAEPVNLMSIAIAQRNSMGIVVSRDRAQPIEGTAHLSTCTSSVLVCLCVFRNGDAWLLWHWDSCTGVRTDRAGDCWLLYPTNALYVVPLVLPPCEQSTRQPPGNLPTLSEAMHVGARCLVESGVLQVASAHRTMPSATKAPLIFTR